MTEHVQYMCMYVYICIYIYIFIYYIYIYIYIHIKYWEGFVWTQINWTPPTTATGA